MNNEYYKPLLTVPWKTTTCNQGEQCWCRIISPAEPILDEEGEEVYIAPSGSIPKLLAEYIVRLHNMKFYPNRRNYLKNKLSISPPD